MTKNTKSTICVHNAMDKSTGGVVLPLHVSTSYAFPNVTKEVIYPGSFNTPGQEDVTRKLAALEETDEAIITASGQSAIAASLMAFLAPGNHVLFHGEQYGGTTFFILNVLEKYGITYDFVFGQQTEDFANAIRPETKVIYFESPTNPLLTVLDMSAISALAKKNDITTIIDSTFATPINQNPIKHGIDVLVHSGTKYLNGHSDVSCGVIASSATLMEKIRSVVIAHGAILHPQAIYLLDRGLKTLALRVEKQNASAMQIAEFLLSSEKVEHIYYPGLSNHPTHSVAQKQMNGYGGMISFELSYTPEEIGQRLARLKIIHPAVSLGGVETLISQPYQTSQRMMTKEMRDKLGISNRLVRLSIGIEDTEDLIGDLLQGVLS